LLACASAWASDSRVESLREYLAGRPIQKHAAEFVKAADANGLDWRLLPCISIVETSGGKHVRHRNNIFGWNSGRARFKSVRTAIYEVAERLAQGRYEGRSTHSKLHQYNPARDRYARKVQRYMKELGQLHDRLRERDLPPSADY
jgi:hypothetical protein